MSVSFEDKKLVKQVLAGDARAFDRFFDDYFGRLYRFALARLGDDPDAARELAQITLSKALAALASWKGEASLFTWLCSICRNELSDWIAKQSRYRAHVVLIEDYAEVRAAVDSLRAPSQASPEQAYRRVELLRLIQVALDNLPPRYGDVLEWKYIEGYSVREIAERMNIGTEATQSLLARAKRAFADVYVSLSEGLEQHESELVRS